MFVDIKCAGERYIISGTFQAIICPVDGNYCIYTGYCSQRRRVRHTEKAKTCAKRKNYRKEIMEK